MRNTTISRLALALVLVLASPVVAQVPDPEALAKDPALFLNTAQKALKWNEPAEPTKIAGPLYRVDPEGYRKWLAGAREKFNATVRNESRDD